MFHESREEKNTMNYEEAQYANQAALVFFFIFESHCDDLTFNSTIFKLIIAIIIIMICDNNGYDDCDFFSFSCLPLNNYIPIQYHAGNVNLSILNLLYMPPSRWIEKTFKN